MMSSTDLHKFADVIFRVTQKLGQIIYNKQRNIFDLVL